jgi:hypothetical protein
MSSPPPRNSICWTAEPVGCARLGVGIALAFGCLLGVARAEGGCPEYATPPRKLGGVPAVLPELSGMAASRRHPGVLWAHNDSGNDAEVFAVRETGEVLATLRLAMSRIDGLSNKEIADKLNISVRTVENQIYRALKTLKENLKDYLFLVPIFF